MRDPFAASRILAQRVVQTQLWTGLVVAAVVMAATHKIVPSVAVLWGSVSVAAAHWMFARRQLRGMATVQTLLRRFYSAAAWKWLVVFGLFVLGLVVLQLPAGTLLTGFIAAQIAGTWALLRYG